MEFVQNLLVTILLIPPCPKRVSFGGLYPCWLWQDSC